ncbi:IclR family transcriptional regulator [Nocardia sp. CA-120079]|uniref:IclR family transcriptional regulator n=1 Tax=Nocardia sp. CA-120079 TaxID=3239974 RepID=UPI003D95FB03
MNQATLETPPRSVYAAEAQSSAGKALDVLRLFDGTRATLGVTDVAATMAIPKSTAHRFLKTLVTHGYAVRRGDRYRLSPHTFHLGNLIPECQVGGLRDCAGVAMSELFLRTRQTVQLAILSGDEVLYIDRVRSPGHPGARIGSRRPAHCTASGKAILAFDPAMGEPLVSAPDLPRRTRNTLIGSGLADSLNRAIQCGYAVDLCEFQSGTCCVAAPIFEVNTRKILGSISLTFPFTDPETVKRLGRHVLDAARMVRPVARDRNGRH